MLRAATAAVPKVRAATTRTALRHGSGGGGGGPTPGWSLLHESRIDPAGSSTVDVKMFWSEDLVGFDGKLGLYIAGMLGLCVVQNMIGLPHSDHHGHDHDHGHDDHEEAEEGEPKYGGAFTPASK